MNARIRKLLFLSLPLLWAGNLGGWALTYKMAGPSAAGEFLYLAALTTSSLFASQVILYYFAKKRLARQLAFLALGGLSLVWFVLCLLLPILWMPSINEIVKSGMVGASVLLFLSNYWLGMRKFKAGWREKNPSVDKYFDSREATLQWDELEKTWRLPISIFVPGVPKKAEPALSILLVLFMLLGLNFRKVYPAFSVFAWGIPCILLSSTIIQILAIKVAEACKVFQMEEDLGAEITPATSTLAQREDELS